MKAFVISSLLIMTSVLMASGLGANQAFGEDNQKTCDIANEYQRYWIDSSLVPEEFRSDRSNQWLCLTPNGYNDSLNGIIINIDDIGDYVVRSISIQIDNEYYNEGDKIFISGVVSPVTNNTPVIVQLFTEGNLVDMAQLTVAQDGSFTKTFLAEGALWKKSGTYLVRAVYGTDEIVDTVTFSYTPLYEPIDQEVEVEVEPNPELTTDWETKYFDMVSKFNDVTYRVGELEDKNQALKSEINFLVNENNILTERILELENKIENLNSLIMEQVRVIYEWVTS